MPILKTGVIKNGRQQYRVRVNYTDLSGNYKRIEKMVYGAAEAKDMESLLISKVKEKSVVHQMTVKELYDEYMRSKRHEVRETTYDKTNRVLSAFVLPELKSTKVSRLSTPVLQRWKDTVSETELSVRTKQNIYSEFRTMLNYAVKMDYIPQNPLNKIGNFKEVYFETVQDKLQYYTPEQFLKYIAVARENCVTLTDWGYYVFFPLHTIPA